MTGQIRIALVIAVLCAGLYMILNMKRSRLRARDSIYWFVFAGLLLVLAFCPDLIYRLSALFGFVSASNLVFLLIIGLLLLRLFQMDVRLSQLNTRFKNLVEEIAIREYNRKREK